MSKHIKCFKFKGKMKCVRTGKKPPKGGSTPGKPVKAEIPVLAFPKASKFGGAREAAIMAAGPKQIGTRTAFVSRDRSKK